MIIIAYFFLLRLGEYMGSKSDSTAFRLEDIAFSCGRSVVDPTATKADLQAATFLMLTLTTKTTGIRGEKICHKASGNPLLCPK